MDSSKCNIRDECCGYHGLPERISVFILLKLGEKDRSTVCHQRILSYFGHITRYRNDSLEKLAIVDNIMDKRKEA